MKSDPPNHSKLCGARKFTHEVCRSGVYNMLLSFTTFTHLLTIMTSRPAHSKRPSSTAVAELAAKPPCKIHPSAVVADKAAIIGSHEVELGEHTVLHPGARIKAENGKVTVGRCSIICETAVIGGEGDLHIGDGVVIESGAIIEAKSIGDGTVIESKVKVGRGAIIGKVHNVMLVSSPRNIG